MPNDPDMQVLWEHLFSTKPALGDRRASTDNSDEEEGADDFSAKQNKGDEDEDTYQSPDHLGMSIMQKTVN